VPRTVQDALQRRDEARWRTRRLSWLIGGGAAAASMVLGVLFSQLLPGRSAAASTAGAAQPGAAAPAGNGQATAGRPRRHAQSQAGPAQPAQAPAPPPAPPQVVSGGS
jgi:hypothetical protein